MGVASMMGWLRNWMGVENMVYMMFDAPDAVVLLEGAVALHAQLKDPDLIGVVRRDVLVPT